MSATHDKNQKATFVYSNLYQLYRKEKDLAAQAQATQASVNSIAQAPESAPLGVSAGVAKGIVLKADDSRARVEAYTPPSFLSPVGKRVARPQYLPPSARTAAVDSLKENLKTLNDLHSKLKFMLQELEDLIK